MLLTSLLRMGLTHSITPFVFKMNLPITWSLRLWISWASMSIFRSAAACAVFALTARKYMIRPKPGPTNRPCCGKWT